MREPTAPASDDRRVPEYDDWHIGRCGCAARERPGFDGEPAAVVATLAELGDGEVPYDGAWFVVVRSPR